MLHPSFSLRYIATGVLFLGLVLVNQPCCTLSEDHKGCSTSLSMNFSLILSPLIAAESGGADGWIIIFNETELIDPGIVGVDDVFGEISPFFQNADSVTRETCEYSQRLSGLVLV